MSQLRTWFGIVGALALAAPAGCGGGGHGFGVDTDPIVITSNALPPTLSGQLVNHQIPFSGGSGGPYILELLSGELPEGVNLDSETVSLVGRALEDGTFDFRLKLTDTGSQPFSTTTADFHWEIGIGALVFATDADLPDVIFNEFVSIQLILAGGVGPYSCEVADDPSNPNDEDLPLGMSIPPDSCSIIGAPQEAKPGGAPFLVTIRARDHADDPGFPNPATVTKTFELTVLVPPIIIATASLPDGKCGTPYSDKIEIVDGVPPFRHSIVTDVNQTTRLKGEPGTVGGIPKASSPESAYPLDSDSSTSYNKRFPEGLSIYEDTGEIKGVPRRRGTFVDWTYYVQSLLLPAEPSQNQWKNFTFTMADAVPPAFLLDPSVLAPGNTQFTPPNNKIPELEVSKPYSLQFRALNGVAQDGLRDAPHDVQVNSDPTEEAGLYDFVASFAPNPPPAGMTFGPHGLFSGTPTQRSAYKPIALTAFDEQLPDSTRHSVSGQVQYAVGPDIVVISETLSGTASTVIDVSYAMGDQTVEIFEPFAGAPTVRQLAAGDMAATHVNPTGVALDLALKNIDFVHASVNPTWWANDVYNLNTRAARAAQHADAERRHNADNRYSDVFRKILVGSTGELNGYEHGSNLAVELPELGAAVAAPVHNPAVGVYRDGGLLYGYDSASEFGFFVVRKDGKIYVPISFNKAASGFTGFGDGWLTSDRTRTSAVRVPQIAVSPDGRTAAVKVKANINNFTETAAASRIAVFSLTGEKPFGGATFRVATTGSLGTSATGGTYLYGDTLTLTNRHLYYLTGDFEGVSSSAVIYARHYVYRYEIAGLAVAGTLLPPGPGVLGTQWTNTVLSPLATPYHRWQISGANSLPSGFNPASSATFAPTTPTALGNTGPNPRFFASNYANMSESSLAPHPFRVSASGNAVAILASPNTLGGTPPSVDFQKYFLFVDFDSGSGVPTFREVGGGVARRYGGAARNGGLRPGDEQSQLYGWYDGPASQLEISDDGKRVAAVYNTSTNSWSTSGASNDPAAREDVHLFSGTGAATDVWSSTATPVAVTGTVFGTPMIWRFGTLAFTRDHNGLVFWGGYSVGDNGSNSTSSTTVDEAYQSGTLYAYNITGATWEGIVPNADGGSTDGIKTYSTGTKVAIAAAQWTGNQGAIAPIGAFYSNDGKFFYLESHASLSGSDSTANRLVGVNVSAATGAATNGRAVMRGFAPTWPSRRGFGPQGYYYYPNFRLRGSVGTGGQRGFTQQVSAAGHKGLVYFVGYYQSQSGSTGDSVTTSFSGGGPAHPVSWLDYGGQAGEIFGLDASVGGNTFQLTNLGGTTTFRQMNYLQPNRAGNRLAFLQSTSQSSFSYDHAPNKEQIGLVSNIQVHATTGALLSSSAVATLEGAIGRAGPSMAHDYTDTKLFYSFTTGSNENNMLLVEKTMDAAGVPVNTRTQGGILQPSGQARFAVLHSGR